MVKSLISTTLTGMGIDVIDLDYSTTPTVEMWVPHVKASGGIIITARQMGIDNEYFLAIVVNSYNTIASQLLFESYWKSR